MCRHRAIYQKVQAAQSWEMRKRRVCLHTGNENPNVSFVLRMHSYMCYVHMHIALQQIHVGGAMSTHLSKAR